MPILTLYTNIYIYIKYHLNVYYHYGYPPNIQKDLVFPVPFYGSTGAVSPSWCRQVTQPETTKKIGGAAEQIMVFMDTL